MIYITEFNNFYKENDIVLIEYWYHSNLLKTQITPVKILEKKGNKFLVSHNNEHSKLKNAPDELISKKDIVDKFKL